MANISLSRAPVRICDIGGWTDTWFYPRGAVFNICVDLYNYVQVIKNNINKIRIKSENLNLSVEFEPSEIKYNGKLDLLKAAVKVMEIKEGIDINVRSEIPPGCGTGTSASVAVALIAALCAFREISRTPLEIAKLAHKIEIDELGLESGIQDQCAAAYGGINFIEVEYPSAKVTPISISKQKKFELENSLIVLYFGTRSSSKMHKAVIERYKAGNASTVNSFEILKNCAYDMKEAIHDTLKEIGSVMYRNWEAQKKLHPLMTNNAISEAEKIAKKHDALGFKLNGAGGGGSATILSDPLKVNSLKNELMQKGYTLLPCKLCFEGVFSYKKQENT